MFWQKYLVMATNLTAGEHSIQTNNATKIIFEHQNRVERSAVALCGQGLWEKRKLPGST